MPPHQKKLPFNENVHSASFADQSNSRTIVSDFRFMRHHIQVFYDHSDGLFHLEQYEHKRLIDSKRSTTDEFPLEEKFITIISEIAKLRLHELRFAKHRGVDKDYLAGEGHIPHVRQFDRSKVPQRNFLDRYKPFDPNQD